MSNAQRAWDILFGRPDREYRGAVWLAGRGARVECDAVTGEIRLPARGARAISCEYR